MRGNQIADVEFVLGELRLQDWTALSEIEQARMSLAIARYALSQLQSGQTPNGVLKPRGKVCVRVGEDTRLQNRRRQKAWDNQQSLTASC